MSFTKLDLRGSPARLIVQTDDGIAFSFSSSAMAEGTVFTRVTSEAADNAATARAFSATITLAPQLNGANSSNIERSKHMEVEANTQALSAGGNTVCVHDKSATRLRCVIATPFGLPAEPEV